MPSVKTSDVVKRSPGASMSLFLQGGSLTLPPASRQGDEWQGRRAGARILSRAGRWQESLPALTSSQDRNPTRCWNEKGFSFQRDLPRTQGIVSRRILGALSQG